MTLIKHELRQGRIAFWIWTGAIGFLLAVCIFLYPEMKEEMEGVMALSVPLVADAKAGKTWAEAH